MFKVFTTREVAIAIYAALLLLYLLLKTKQQVINVIKCALSKQLVVPFVFLLLYVSAIVFVVSRLKFWSWVYLKDVIVWFVFAGVPFCYNSVARNLPEKYFLNGITENIKLIILVEYVTGTYTFNFAVEMILQPVLLLVTAMSTIAQQDEKHKQTKFFFDVILAIIGFCILGFSITRLIQSVNTIEYQDVLFELISPLVLSLLFWPFAYGFALYSKYQIVFLRMKVMGITAINRRLMIVKQCGVSYKKISFYVGRIGKYFYMDISNAKFQDAIDIINEEYLSNQEQRRQ